MRFSCVHHQENVLAWLVWFFHLSLVFQGVRQIIDQELCPYFYTPTTSGETNYNRAIYDCVVTNWGQRLSTVSSVSAGEVSAEYNGFRRDTVRLRWPWFTKLRQWHREHNQERHRVRGDLKPCLLLSFFLSLITQFPSVPLQGKGWCSPVCDVISVAAAFSLLGLMLWL